MPMDVKGSHAANDIDGEPDEYNTHKKFEGLAGPPRNRSTKNEDGSPDQEQSHSVPNAPHGSVPECATQGVGARGHCRNGGEVIRLEGVFQPESEAK